VKSSVTKVIEGYFEQFDPEVSRATHATQRKISKLFIPENC
jgi:hypothetical protein